jgi:hypothetical protein
MVRHNPQVALQDHLALSVHMQALVRDLFYCRACRRYGTSRTRPEERIRTATDRGAAEPVTLAVARLENGSMALVQD